MLQFNICTVTYKFTNDKSCLTRCHTDRYSMFQLTVRNKINMAVCFLWQLMQSGTCFPFAEHGDLRDPLWMISVNSNYFSRDDMRLLDNGIYFFLNNQLIIFDKMLMQGLDLSWFLSYFPCKYLHHVFRRAVVATSQCRKWTATFVREGKAGMGIQNIQLLITGATGA